VTDFRRADEVWDEEDEAADNAKTLVAKNPLSERAPALAAAAGDEEDDESVVSVRESEFEIVDVSGATGRESAEALRDSEVDLLQLDWEPVQATPVSEPAAPEVSPPSLPSVVLAPSFSSRNEVTERVPTIPRTHPLANSIAPTAAPKSVPPATASRTSIWPVSLVALALLGLGVGLARWQEAPRGASAKTHEAEGRAAASTPRPDPRPAPASTPAQPEPAIAPAVASVPAVEATVPAAEPVAARSPAPEPVAPVQVRDAVAPAPPSVANLRPNPKPARASRPARAAENAKTAAVEDDSLESEAAVAPERPAGPAGSGELPDRPSREQVVGVMDSVRGDVTKCTGGRAGIAELTLTVRASGQVTYALVNGTFAGTPEGSCIANVLRAAKFPAFRDPVLRVNYPLQL
jgi:hypothetical protein